MWNIYSWNDMICGICFYDPGWGGVKQYWLWIDNGWRWKTGTWELIIFFYFSTCLKFSVIKIPHLIFLALSTEKIPILYLRLTWPVWFMFVSSNLFDPYNTLVGAVGTFYWWGNRKGQRSTDALTWREDLSFSHESRGRGKATLLWLANSCTCLNAQ